MLGWMHEAEVPDDIHDPELLVASGRLDDLLGRRQFDQGCVFHLGADRDDVLRVILHRARGLLR